MDFLADESCAAAVVRRLRGEGHDVLSVSDFGPGSDDEAVQGLAFRDSRVLITEDRDFGELVFARRRQSAGVVLIRFPSAARAGKAAAVAEAVRMLGPKLRNAFVVLEPGRVRRSVRP